MGVNEERVGTIETLEQRLEELLATPIKLSENAVTALIERYATMLENTNNERHQNYDTWEEKHDKLVELVEKWKELDLNIRDYTYADLPDGDKWPLADSIPLRMGEMEKEEYYEKIEHRTACLTNINSALQPLVDGLSELTDEVSSYETEWDEISDNAEGKLMLEDAYLNLDSRLSELRELQDKIDRYEEITGLLPL